MEIRRLAHAAVGSPRVVAGALVVGATALALAVSTTTQPRAWYPSCLFHSLVGLHCPGCGSTRALLALAHGEWLRAAHENALLVALLPFLGAWTVIALWRAWRFNAPAPAAPQGTAMIVLVATLVFFVARNLPWWPFTLLAPI